MSRTPGKLAVLLAVAAIASLTACSKSEEAPPQDAPSALPGAPGQEPPDPLQAEYATLSQRLSSIQQQAMADSSLQKEYAALEAFVEGAMMATDPELPAHRERMGSLQAELSSAQQAEDQEKMQELVQEGTALQVKLQQVQATTMQQEDVATRMAAFREHMIARMSAIDAETPTMIARSDEIAAQLRGPAPGAAAGAGTGTGND